MNEEAKSPEKQKPTYSLGECVFAWISILLGYLFCRLFPGVDTCLGGFLFLLLIYAVTLVTLILRKAKLGRAAVFALAVGLASAFPMLIGSGEATEFFAYFLSLGAYLYFVSAAFGNTLESGLSSLILIDFFRSVFCLPFASFGAVFRALTGGKNEKKGVFSGILKALIGVAVAVIPTVIIVSSLEYDSGFSSLLRRIFSFDFEEIFSHIVSFLFGIPVAMYIFGAYSSSREHKSADMGSNSESLHKKAEKTGFAPAITAVFASLPIIFVYCLFFVSQWKYFVSGFTGTLPEGYSYAEYARSGFFELCSVAFINLIIVAALSLFMKRKNGGKSAVLSILTLVFCLSSLVLIATAGAKMIMYVAEYGMTPLRFYSSWFIILLAVLFALTAVMRLIGSKKILPVSVIVSVAAFLVIAVIPVDSLVADRNADRYIEGSLPKVDVEFLVSLGDAAIPAMCRLEQYWTDNPGKADSIDYIILRQRLSQRKNDSADHDFFSLNIVNIRAEQAVRAFE